MFEHLAPSWAYFHIFGSYRTPEEDLAGLRFNYWHPYPGVISTSWPTQVWASSPATAQSCSVSLKLHLVRCPIKAMKKQWQHHLDRDQARVMVKQYSFFNTPLQMEAPELIPTPTPTQLPGDLQMRPLPQPGGRGGLPLPVMAYLKKS